MDSLHSSCDTCSFACLYAQLHLHSIRDLESAIWIHSRTEATIHLTKHSNLKSGIFLLQCLSNTWPVSLSQSSSGRVCFFISQEQQSKLTTLVLHLTLLSSRRSYLSEAHSFCLCHSSEPVQGGNKWPWCGVSILCTIMVCEKDSILWPTEFRASVLWSKNTFAVPWLGEYLSLCHIPIAQHNQRQTAGTQHIFIKWLQHLLAPSIFMYLADLILSLQLVIGSV